jgi:N-acetyltransferase
MPSPLPPGTPSLIGQLVRLELLTAEHVSAVTAASAGDRSTFGFGTVPGGSLSSPTEMVAERLALATSGAWVPFVQVNAATGDTVGMTNLMAVDSWPDGRPLNVEIGGTWLAQSAQRSGINTEAKLLLLTHAFETWNVERVQLKTDERNARSRAAIARLGATFEGILRSFQPGHGDIGTGDVRSTAMFSFIRSEWPDVKARLNGLLRE